MGENNRDNRRGLVAVLVAVITSSVLASGSCMFGGRNVEEKYLRPDTTYIRRTGDKTFLDYVDKNGEKRQVELTYDNLEKMTRR